MVQNFDPFRTEHREEGLEVARAKRIARLLDSRLIIRTGPGRCSVSAFELPMALVSNQMDPRMSGWSPIQQNTGKVIVVIDDEVSVQESLALLLADWGHLPVVELTAAGILDQLARRPVSPDLIIADYQLANGQLGTKAIAEIRHSCAADSRHHADRRHCARAAHFRTAKELRPSAQANRAGTFASDPGLIAW